MCVSASNYDFARRSALPQPLTRISKLVRLSLRAAPVSQAKNFGRCLRNAPLKARKIHSQMLVYITQTLTKSICESEVFTEEAPTVLDENFGGATGESVPQALDCEMETLSSNISQSLRLRGLVKGSEAFEERSAGDSLLIIQFHKSQIILVLFYLKFY